MSSKNLQDALYMSNKWCEMDRHKYTVEYLLNNGSETIKYRVLTELCAIQNPTEVERLRKAIIDSVRYN